MFGQRYLSCASLSPKGSKKALTGTSTAADGEREARRLSPVRLSSSTIASWPFYTKVLNKITIDKCFTAKNSGLWET